MEINDDYFAHYGILRESGRYPWGSGATPSERGDTFLSIVEKHRKEDGMTNVEIAKLYDISTTELINTRSNVKNAQKQANIGMAQRLSDKGWSNVAIGKRMGVGESTVRTWLQPGELDKLKVINSTADILRQAVADKKYVDVGSGVEQHLNVTSSKLAKAISQLTDEGYSVHTVKVDQVGTGQKTTLKVLVAPDTEYTDLLANRDQISLPFAYSEDMGRSFDKVQPPISINSKRVDVKYAEQGGKDADGVIYVRPGVKDTSLGSASYAQVRVAVDGTHYLKGMAMYKDDLPEGVDLQFNTNKSDTGNKLDAMKPMKSDPTNPFGSVVRQIGDPDPKDPTKKVLTSVMNVVNDEGDWDEWSKTLSSQMLSKQPRKLAEAQLNYAFKKQQDEFDSLKDLDNPSVKKKLLDSFADGADSAAVHLKAAALPRTQNRVILPMNSLKPTEIYAPSFRDGERVVLIRYPHGGKFEIPELTVNNRNPEAKKLLGNAADAVGIHSDVAKKLSGADFDGDTVLVIPNPKGDIKTEPALNELKDFDPQHAYPKYDGMHVMTSDEKGLEMGKISNLITDMTIGGATNSELGRAIRHSMVVIDAEKHKLNYRQSAIDNGISALKVKYQGKGNAGAKTIISRASSQLDVPERKQGFRIDPETGKKIFTETGATYASKPKLNKKTGEYTTTIETKMEKSTKLAETDDAHTLSSGTPIEAIYADHSNRMKDLANQARLESLRTKTTPYSPEARVKYSNEVEHLEASLSLALRNSPLERLAQIKANGILKQKRVNNPDMDKSEFSKLKFAALEDARASVGAGKKRIDISADEWTAIQAGAITNNMLKQILNNADLDKIKELATPKEHDLMSDDKITRAIALRRNGYTEAEVADQLGVSLTTLKRSLKGGDK